MCWPRSGAGCGRGRRYWSRCLAAALGLITLLWQQGLTFSRQHLLFVATGKAFAIQLGQRESVFLSHPALLASKGLASVLPRLTWLSGIPVHVGLQGNLELWLDNPLRFAGIAHSLWEPHFGIAAEQPWRDHFHPLASGLAAACFYCWSRSVGFVSASQFLTFGSALEVRALCLCLSAGLGCWMGSCWLTPCLVSSQLSQPCRALALGSLLWSGHLGWAAHAGSQLTQRATSLLA